MNTRFKIGSAGLLLAAIALLLAQPHRAQAHPQLVGTWYAVAPANTFMSYSFEPGEYVGGGIWRGCCTVYLANNPISCGVYELKILEGTKGTLTIRDGAEHMGYTSAGIIDLGANRELGLKGVLYRQ